MKIIVSLLLVMVLFILGCSGGNNTNPSVPDTENLKSSTTGEASSHMNWGLWRFICHPESQTIDVVQLRTGSMHLNALPFINLPPLVYVTLETLNFNGNLIETDIGLRHPFLGLNEFTGFDVKGVFISNGSLTGFTDSDLILTGPGDTRLLNPDGYTRWWNPAEFPDNGTMFGYTDGILGTPDATADYNSTLNGYKYYCDDLTAPDAPLTDIDPTGRGVFSAGQKNVRHFSIELGDAGLVFNYAVDASWHFPTGPKPWDVPDDFPPDANQPEAYRIAVHELENTLFYDETTQEGGGNLRLGIDAYDWFGANLHTVKIEWPGFAAQTPSTGPIGGGTGFSTYEIDLPDCTPTAVGEQQLLITVESESEGYGGILPGKFVSSYFMYNVNVEAGSETVDPPDICTGWGNETGPYYFPILNIFTQFNLASDSNGNVWMWCHRTSNALSRCSTPFNGDWATMTEEYDLDGYYEVFTNETIDVSLTPTFDGGMIAGCSPKDTTDVVYPNPLSIAWWDGSMWHEKTDGQWLLYDVTTPEQIARRINGYRDSTGRFHAFCQVNGQLIDFYGDTWKGGWSQVTVGNMPAGQPDFMCQTRTDFVSESSDGYIYLCWVDVGLKVARCKAGTTTWNIVFQNNDPNYDSPTIYVDGKDRVFLVARYMVSATEDKIYLFRSTNGTDFSDAELIFSEANTRVDPCYLALKGDVDNNLFLTFPYRPGNEGAYAAIIAGNPGGTIWTDVCVLSDNPLIKHPALAVRPDGSIEVCYGLCTYPYYGAEEGGTDNPFSERNEIYGKSNPGFID